MSGCPNCAAPRVHRSRPRGPLEYALSLLGVRLRRCHACNLRFCSFGRAAIPIEHVSLVLRTLSLFLLMLTGTAAVLLLLTWFISRQA